ncbi:halocyanin domain-containing protein [Halosimplex sp. J119]
MTDASHTQTRRACLELSLSVVAGGLLAGCTNQSGDGGSTSGESTLGADGSSSAGSSRTSESPEQSPSTAAGTDTDETAIPALSDEATEYLSDAQQYDGEGLADYTGQSEVTVENGAGMRGMAFDPAAIAVDAGTAVVWEWTGRGGEHDVVAVDGSFESELVESSEKTYSRTFDATGEFLYNCSEHEDKGMKGVVVVV